MVLVKFLYFKILWRSVDWFAIYYVCPDIHSSAGCAHT